MGIVDREASPVRTRCLAYSPALSFRRVQCLFNLKILLILIACLSGPLAFERATADAPPWEIWDNLHRLAEVRPGQRVLLRGSHCPSGCRFDRHSSGDWRYIRVDGDEGVIFEETGAGAITRIWMTMGQGTSQPLDPSVHLRVYIDGADRPVLDMPLPDFFNGSTKPFLPPLVGDRLVSSGGNFSYVPIPYRNGCRVTLVGADEQRIWFQFSHHRLAEPGEVVSFLPDTDLGSWKNLLENSAQDPWQITDGLQGSMTVENELLLAPGDSVGLASFAGPDSLNGLRFRLPETAWPEIELRMVFDGSERVRLPLNDFFAIGHGGSDGTRSLLLGTDAKDSLYSYFPMPFFEHAEISLSSHAAPGSAPVVINSQIRRANRPPSRSSALFGAQRWIDNETPIGVEIPMLSLQGEGKWVGLFADLGSVNTSKRSYLEGDERVYFDDSLHPEVYGTGTEDFYNGGFYFDQGPFRLALHGSPYHHLLENGEDSTAAYRLMLTDGISFSSNLSAGLEGGPTDNISLRAHSVAYYYLRSTAGLWRSDVLDLGDPESRAQHGYAVSGPHENLLLNSFFEGTPAVALQAVGIYRPPGEAHFRLRAVPGAKHLRLRRRMDANFAGQEAEIWADGKLVGRFPPEDLNSDRRWREISIDLLSTTVKRGGEIEFTIKALPRPGITLPGDSLFTAFTYELWTEVSPQLFADGFLPTGVTATDGTFSDRVRLTFNPVAGAAVYRVFRCQSPEGACGLPIGFPKNGVFDDKKALPGQLYYYRVRACTSTICGAFTTADQGHIGIGARPDTPLNIKATDGSYDDRVQLTWTAVGNATVYRVFRCLDTGRTCGSPIGFPKTDIFEDDGGKPGTVYFYRLRACTSTHCSNFSVGDSGYRGPGVSPSTK